MGDTMAQFNDEKYRRDADEYLEEYMGISEIGKFFETMMEQWQNYDNRRAKIRYIEKNKDQLCTIKTSLETAQQISYDFYKSIGLENEYNRIIEGKSGIEVNIGTTKEGKGIWSSGLQQEENGDYLLNVTNHNSIETAFVISHEFMHVITMYKEFNEAKYLLRETCPYIIELLLCDFIVDNGEKYNLKENLINDLIIIKLMRFLNYYDKTNRCLRNDYIIALLITTQLENKSKEEQLKALFKILNSLEKDNIIETLESLRLKLNKKEQNNRIKYIEDMFNTFTNLFEKLSKKERSKTY